MGPFIKKYMGARDLINNRSRYCLWLKDCDPSQLRSVPQILERLEGVRKSRLASKKKATQEKSVTPALFTEDRQPDKDYLMVPVVSSSNRRYIPMAFVSKDTIANTNAQMIPDAEEYHFGILSSNVHMAWVRVVAGRMKSDYAYSGTIVYNNFPWIELSEQGKEKIKTTAQGILEARKIYLNSTLADLYDELTMPVELRKAHQANDKAVMEAYGMMRTVNGKKVLLSESETVAKLFQIYEKIVTN